MATTGRKDPCPCGSGRVYEKCCMSVDIQDADAERALPVFPEMDRSIDSRTFRSRMVSSDDLQKLFGISREAMYILLYEPFSVPGLVSFNLDLKQFPESPFLRIFHSLVTAIGTSGLNATAKGYLPPALVRETALRYYGEKEYLSRKEYMTFRTEMDFPVLHTVRLTAQLAGFVRKYRNRFQPTKAGREVLARGLDGRFFMKLFSTYGTRFHWAYNDGSPEIHIVQQAFLFTLYLLSRHGDRFRPASFYEDQFLAAFPEEIPEIPETRGRRGEEILRDCFTVRSLSRFAHFFGFVEMNSLSNPGSFRLREIRKTPFLDQWVRFGKLDTES